MRMQYIHRRAALDTQGALTSPRQRLHSYTTLCVACLLPLYVHLHTCACQTRVAYRLSLNCAQKESLKDVGDPTLHAINITAPQMNL